MLAPVEKRVVGLSSADLGLHAVDEAREVRTGR